MPNPSSWPLPRPVEAAVATLALVSHAQPRLLVAAALAGLVLPPTLVAAFRAAARSYRSYLAIGPGGIPHNIVGWMAQGLCQLIAIRDPLATRPFETPSRAVLARYGEGGQKSYLASAGAPLPLRAGAAPGKGLETTGRPAIPAFVAPHRQTTQKGSPATRRAQDAFLQSLAAANPDVLAIRPSQLEGNETPALFAKQGRKLGVAFWDRVPFRTPPAPRGPVEIAHTHAEGSTHMIFSLKDALQVMQNGWGERHLLSGSPGARMPLTYLIVYAPRDEAELQVWKALALASARFCAGEHVAMR